MAETRRLFTCELLTPLGSVFDEEVVSVVLPALDGQMGIMGGHTPMVTMLGCGPLTMKKPDGGCEEYILDGGFARICEDRMTIMAEKCDAMAKVDPEKVWDELERAKRMPAESEDQLQARQEAVTRARTRFRLVQAWRKRDRERKRP